MVIVDQFEEDECADDGDDPGDHDSGELVEKLDLVASRDPEGKALPLGVVKEGLTALRAKTPVRIAPGVPPAP